MLKADQATARRLGLSDLFVVNVPKGSEQAVANKLAKNPHFKFAELDYRVAAAMTPNDPYMGSAWHLPKIGAPAAWDGALGGSITVAVLDSGVDGSHPDLVSKLVSGWNFYDGNSNTTDVYGHGTKVAGTVAAAGNNGLGVASVAPQTMIMPIRVTDTSGAGWTSMIANGLIYAADRGVRLANISFANMPARSSVVSAAQYMKDRGGLVFVGAGNNGIDEALAPTTSLIVVSATDTNDGKAGWSSYGDFVSLSAPGVGIYTTTSGGGYAAVSGTSFATPVAAGVAALAMSARPSLTSAQVETLLFNSAVDLGSAGRDKLYGFGRVDASRAVNAALVLNEPRDMHPPSVSIATSFASSNISGLIPVDVSSTDNVGVVRVDLLVNGTAIATDTMPPFAFSWDSTKSANGVVSLTAVAFDAAGNLGTSTPVVVNVSNNTAADTMPPVVTFLSPSDGTRLSGPVSIRVAASDDSESGTLSQTLFIDGKQVAASTGPSLSYNWNPKKSAPGAHSIEVVVTDVAGNSTRLARQVIK